MRAGLPEEAAEGGDAASQVKHKAQKVGQRQFAISPSSQITAVHWFIPPFPPIFALPSRHNILFIVTSFHFLWSCTAPDRSVCVSTSAFHILLRPPTAAASCDAA